MKTNSLTNRDNSEPDMPFESDRPETPVRHLVAITVMVLEVVVILTIMGLATTTAKSAVAFLVQQ